MPSFMFSSSDSLAATNGYHIAYEELADYAQDWLELHKAISYGRPHTKDGAEGGAFEFYDSFVAALKDYEAVKKMRFMVDYMSPATGDLDKAARTALNVWTAFNNTNWKVLEAEKKIQRMAYMPAGNFASDGSTNWPHSTEGHAEGFYAAAAAAEAQRIKDEEEAAAAAAAATAAAAAAAAKQEEWLEWARINCPELYDEYMQKLADAERAEWEKWMQENDPEAWERYQEIRAAQEKARQEAEAAAAALEAELAEADARADGFAASGLDEPSESPWDELDADLGADLGSDFGGGGGGGGFDSGGLGSVDDWAGDLLSDTLDTEELSSAGGALDSIASASTGLATGGVDALSGGDDVGAAASGLLGQYGDKLASFAAAYGLQAAAALGGAAVLYATREQTTEAVARVAEFMTTKSKPFAADVMDQVKGAARQTGVSVSRVRSRAVGVARGEREGDLLG